MIQSNFNPVKLKEQILAILTSKNVINSTKTTEKQVLYDSDAEMRPSFDTLKKHRLFMQDKPTDYW